jgi:hypothetical protein
LWNQQAMRNMLILELVVDCTIFLCCRFVCSK